MRFSIRPVHGFAIVSVSVAAGALAIAGGCSGGGDSAIGADEGGAGSSSSGNASSSGTTSGSSSGGSSGASSSGGSSSGGSSGGGATDAAFDSGPKPCKTPADCNDNSPCTTDECAPSGFCTYKVAGDGDGDGFASSTLGACGKDCDDSDPLVSPDSGWYEKTRDAGAGLDGSFDWNCDGFAQPRWNTLWKGCNVSQGKCVGSGWATKIRGCGERGTYVNCFVSNGECASFDYPDSGQECR